MAQSHQITIVDIARALNISKSTVSRALNGYPDVSEMTRMQVLELAEKLGYQKNMLAYQLVSSKSFTIGIIVPELITSFFPRVIVGAQQAAHRLGYNIFIAQSNETYQTEVQNTKIMAANRVDGLLISLSKETQQYGHIETLIKRGIPVVLFNRISTQLNMPKVVVDDYLGAFTIVEHLIKSGCRRIAHIAGPATIYNGRKRKEGYLDALKKNGIPVDDQIIIDYDLNPEKATLYFDYLLNLSEPPDGIFAFHDSVAIEIIQRAKSMQIAIPEKIAIAGFSDDSSSQYIEPGLTTIAQPTAEMGQIGIELLLTMINQRPEDWKPITKVLNPELIIRSSTGR